MQLKHPALLLAFLVFFHQQQAQGIKKISVDELETLISTSNKPLVVNFWATWCASCVEEIPWFIKTVNEKYKGRVDMVLVSLDIKSYYPQKISAFAAKRRFDAPLLWLNESNADVFCPKIDPQWSGAIPSTLMVNNKNRYRKFYEQGLSPLQLERELGKLVGE